MKQSRFMSMLESIINIAVGFGISMGAQITLLPMLGVTISLSQNFQFALIMTAISIARSFALRRLFEALHIRVPMSPALQSIAAERLRQKNVEGWDDAHDDAHAPGDMARAGAAYALSPSLRHSRRQRPSMPPFWPWSIDWWKPVDNRRDLIRAGALIVAELDRENRSRKSRGRSA